MLSLLPGAQKGGDTRDGGAHGGAGGGEEREREVAEAISAAAAAVGAFDRHYGRGSPPAESLRELLEAVGGLLGRGAGGPPSGVSAGGAL